MHINGNIIDKVSNICVYENIKLSIVLIYRPPEANKSSFSKIIKFMKSSIEGLDTDYQTVLLGDFNFPFIDWESGSVGRGVRIEMQQSADEFLNLLSSLMMNQYVYLPTRGENTLDLFFTDNPFMVTHVSTEYTDLSDHKMVNVLTSLDLNLDWRKKKWHKEESFAALDFRKANFQTLNDKFSSIDWEQLMNLCSLEEFPVLFTLTLLQVCQEVIPRKRPKTGKPRILNALRRRKKRVLARLNKIENYDNREHIVNLERKLALISYQMKEAFDESAETRECLAISNIKSNPKVFYNYAKSHSHIKSSIHMLIDEEKSIVTDKGDIANLLQSQFSSVYSDPNAPNIKIPNFSIPNIVKEMKLDSLEINDDTIRWAINELDVNSAAGPDEVPAQLLKACAESLICPIKLLWKESIAQGIVPEYYKNSHVCPIYKKGDRAIPGNYRPVSLTSHIVKLCERILRRVIIEFVETNRLLSSNQHGFRSGRSCLTQMLAHFDDIYQGLCNNEDTDSIYLDYAKAFDKVDHKLLIMKLKNTDSIRR